MEYSSGLVQREVVRPYHDDRWDRPPRGTIDYASQHPDRMIATSIVLYDYRSSYREKAARMPGQDAAVVNKMASPDRRLPAII